MEDGEDNVEVPGYRNYWVFCDESGFHGKATYYGFGSLWMPHEARGRFSALMTEARSKTPYGTEFKWSKIRDHNVGAYCALVRAFFEVRWLMFHCLVVKRSDVDQNLHKTPEEGLRKHYTLLLSKKIEFFSRGYDDKVYHVRMDRLPFKYRKSDEAARNVIRHTLRRDINLDPLKSLVERDSELTPGIQMADVLLGAVLAARQGDVDKPAKRKVMEYVAKHLGWPDLTSDTYPTKDAAKFNIWQFWEPKLGARRVATRPLDLLLPMEVYRAPKRRR